MRVLFAGLLAIAIVGLVVPGLGGASTTGVGVDGQSAQISKKHRSKHHGKKHGKKHKKADPFAGKVIPKGTPYAAEVRVVIHGTFLLTREDTLSTLGYCGDGRNQTLSESNSFNIYWNTYFNQVTVPIATRPELGRAAKRLLVPTTPTSNGVNKGSTGDYRESGAGPTGSESCDSVKYEGRGSIDLHGNPSYYKRPFGHRWLVYVFGMPALTSFTPPTVRDSLGEDVSIVNEFINYDQNIPVTPKPSGTSIKDAAVYFENNLTWDAVPALFDTNEMVKLRNRKSLQLSDFKREGELNHCSEENSDGSSDGLAYNCDSGFQMIYEITLKRHSLYKTKRAYRRK